MLGAVLGGLTWFLWSALSWSVLPWHHKTFKAFSDEEPVEKVLLQYAGADGVYGLPAPPGAGRDEQFVFDKMKRGPLVTVVFQRGGYASIAPKMVIALVTGMIEALAFTWLLATFGAGHTYASRALFVGVAAIAGALICRLPDWNWHGYSVPFVTVQVLDVAIGWSLVGLVLAWVTRGL